MYPCISPSATLPGHNKRIHQACFCRTSSMPKPKPSPTIFEVYDCIHTKSAVLFVHRAMLDQTQIVVIITADHTYSCTHAGYKICNYKLLSSLFVWNLPCPLRGLLVLSHKEGVLSILGFVPLAPNEKLYPFLWRSKRHCNSFL